MKIYTLSRNTYNFYYNFNSIYRYMIYTQCYSRNLGYLKFLQEILSRRRNLGPVFLAFCGSLYLFRSCNRHLLNFLLGISLYLYSFANWFTIYFYDLHTSSTNPHSSYTCLSVLFPFIKENSL